MSFLPADIRQRYQEESNQEPTAPAERSLHIAIAAMNAIDYLLTWNCTHIANPSLRRMIDDVFIAADVLPPVICTPQELIHV